METRGKTNSTGFSEVQKTHSSIIRWEVHVAKKSTSLLKNFAG